MLHHLQKHRYAPIDLKEIVVSTMPMVNRYIVSVLTACLVLALDMQTAVGQEKVKFPVGVGTKTVRTHMYWLAAKKGFFDEVGLEVQPVLLRGTSITMQALSCSWTWRSSRRRSRTSTG